MNVDGKSDGPIVPRKPANNGGAGREGVTGPVSSSAERAEGRGPAKGNSLRGTGDRTQGGATPQAALERIRQAAGRDKQLRLTALWHHVYDIDRLREECFTLKPNAAPGVDGQTWQAYGEQREANLRDLSERLKRGAYRARPVKRVWIPKADGQQRPLGIAALEDKIVQQAVVTVLNPIYEEDFLGFSYGFRPGKSQHDALDALWVGLMGKKVNWVLDADVRAFFDNLRHEWLEKFVEHRIADPRILRLIRKWLRAGVTADGKWSGTEAGTPQGAVVSPLLANVYLHYVLDLWVQQWRSRHARGDVVIVRYADDFVMGFQHRDEAERFLNGLRERFAKFGLALHPDKTRLIEFGRFAAGNRKRRGQSKPETFDFLGFTHICGKKHRNGGFVVKRKTMPKRMRAKLKEVRAVIVRRRHEPLPQVGRWVQSVVQGYLNYHAVYGNLARLRAFRTQVARAWLFAVRRRSHRHRMPWARFSRIVDRWLPKPTVLHPYPNMRFYAKHPR